jgi:hypothetical protein
MTNSGVTPCAASNRLLEIEVHSPIFCRHVYMLSGYRKLGGGLENSISLECIPDWSWSVSTKQHHRGKLRALAFASLTTLVLGGFITQSATADTGPESSSELHSAAVADSGNTTPIPVKASAASIQALDEGQNCSAPDADEAIVCIEKASPEQIDGDTLGFANPGVSTMAIQSLPDWCVDGFNRGRLATRTQNCETFGVTITKSVLRNGVMVDVGTAELAVASYQYTSYSTPRVAHQYGFNVSAVTGDVTGVMIDASSTCSGSCTHVAGAIPATAAAPTGWHDAESFATPPTTTAGSIHHLATEWELGVSLPSASGPQRPTLSTGTYDVRCDNAAGGSSPTPGCAVYYVPGVVTYSSATHPTFASHVAQALASGLPGGSMADPLHRTTVTSVINANRSASCGSAPSISGLSCDEYPFASSYEGAASGGSARSFPGCNFTDPAATGPNGFSRCMITASENSSAGAILGNIYRQQRILEADPFYVRIT